MTSFKTHHQPDTRIITFIENNLFFVFSTKTDFQDELLEKVRGQLREATQTIHDLASFSTVVDTIRTHTNSIDNIAAGFLQDDILYVKTQGIGEVFLYRGDTIVSLITNANMASGHVREGDAFIFTASHDLKLSDADIRELRSEKNIEKKGFLVVDIQNKSVSDKEQVAFIPSGHEDMVKGREQKKRSRLVEKLSGLYAELRQRSAASSSRKKFTFFVLIVLFFIFVWSVVLGYQRRQEQAIQRKITASSEEITGLLQKAEEVSFLDPTESNRYILEAKEKANVLHETYGKDHEKDIAPIFEAIEKKQASITKQEEKQPEEFFDLTIESQTAVGSDMVLDGDNVAITDKKNGRVYILSLPKKSLENRHVPEVRDAKTVTYGNDELFFFIPGKGFYKTEGGDSIKKIIDQDPEWGSVLIPGFYNSNLYVLDPQKEDVLKYAPTETGYGAKSSYFKGSVPSLTDAQSLAIDGSLYVGMTDSIAKFTSGLQDSFEVKTPEADTSFYKVLAYPEVEQVYVWDKKKGMLFLLSKEGSYVKSIHSSALQTATDVVVYNNAAYLLNGHLILKIDIQ